MCISPIGYQPFAANNYHIGFQSNPITSAEQEKNTDIQTASLMSTASAWSEEYQNYIDIENPEELYKITAEILNRQYAEIKKIASDKIKNTLSEEQKELIALIEELPLTEDAKIKRLKLYLEAEKKKNKIYREAQEKKTEIYKEAEEKKDKICREAEKKKEKELKKAEENKNKAFQEAESKRQGIYLIAKRRYDLNIISESEFNEVLSSAHKQCEKSKSAAFTKYEKTKITAYKNYESTERTARRDCENTEAAAYREYKSTMYTAFRECDIAKLSADIEYKNVLNLHEKLKETVGEYAYRIIVEQKKTVKLAEQQRDIILAEYADFYKTKSGNTCSNIKPKYGNNKLNNKSATNLNFIC